LDCNEMYAWWNGAARSNAMTAILSNKQDWDPEEFFATGREWLDDHRNFASVAGVDLEGKSALDFGCGIGRVTHALADHFETLIGVDISDEMLNLAREHQRTPSIRFEQVVNLPLPFPKRTFDLVYATIVVQHIPTPYNLEYVCEFFRVARGLVLFDAPSHKIHFDDSEPGDGIFLLSRNLVFTTAESNGFELMALRQFPATSTCHYQYLFRQTR
jgi:ubiquinone/menaquinone biosynthesis C-methylase UbiE